MNKKKVWKIVSNIVFVGLIILLILPSGRTWVQQGLMKIGLFKPKLEKPEEIPDQHGEIEVPSSSNYAGVAFSDDNGEVVNIPDLKGKVVFLNFWATWCPPCKAEMPSIQVLKDKFKDNDQVAFLIVEIEGEKEKARGFMQQGNMDLPIYYPESQIPGEWLGGAIPTTVILDKTGKIAAQHEGMADYSRTEVSDFITELTHQ
ncbi:TlpA family protein disulfide reductase [Sphingobacterium phlebotomi]|uniref:TlpA family protein disulfide reductase n=1 Tax=Sphingobacterium phlebotomi TaxID=2605433 RepID=A0A5D4GR30_9SPHI|nr:TlpA disulfide reductase family protein [Sphingobacterium phlebotomi]TYR31281.1 TlpA family protein disulfide reductase [Sphingobacterium phlebotomi]